MAGGGLSIHCVDVANGKVATGLRVRVRHLNQPQWLVDGTVGSKGLLEDPTLMSDAITAGAYEVVFSVGAFYRAQPGGAGPGPGFLDEVPYHFHIVDVAQHYHLPFKFTAWGFSLFRGGA